MTTPGQILMDILRMVTKWWLYLEGTWARRPPSEMFNFISDFLALLGPLVVTSY